MSNQHLLFPIIFAPVTGWAARRALIGRNRAPREPEKGRFTRSEVERLVDQSWRAFDQLAPDVSQEPTLGSRLNVRMAALTLAMLHTLIAAGIERQYAIELIGDMCWNVYQYWGWVGRFLAQLSGQRRLEEMKQRVRPDGSWPMSFPFNPPGYRARYVPTPEGLGFDVIRCPVAEYFRAHGSVDLAVSTWCMLDYPLAEMLSMKLARSQTLVASSLPCDFRWLPAAEKD